MRVGCGVLLGSSVATYLFNKPCWWILEEWEQQFKTQQSMLNVRSIITDKMINVAVTSFVDDVARKFASLDFNELKRKDQHAADLLGKSSNNMA